MSAPRPASTYGDGQVDRLLTQVLSLVGTDRNDDLVRSLMVTALQMDDTDLDRLDLKIASQALAELLNSARVFSPHRDRSKVTVFGSARTAPDDPDYELAVEFGRLMAERNWMSITGAGPGIMEAGIVGAGLENSLGVGIVLPFEANPAPIIDGDPKLAMFKYFFTRKLAFVMEADAFALFPGGFGTLDEGFELLTLIQTGKAQPAPIVLLDHEDSPYWDRWTDFVRDGLGATGMISDEDLDLVFHTHSAAEAADHICHFFSAYHSLRTVGNTLVLRLRHALSEEAVAQLNDEYADIVVSGSIRAVEPTRAERQTEDNLELPRLGFSFDNKSYARLISLIWRINDLCADGDVMAPSGRPHDLHFGRDDDPVAEDG